MLGYEALELLASMNAAVPRHTLWHHAILPWLVYKYVLDLGIWLNARNKCDSFQHHPWDTSQPDEFIPWLNQVTLRFTEVAAAAAGSICYQEVGIPRWDYRQSGQQTVCTGVQNYSFLYQLYYAIYSASKIHLHHDSTGTTFQNYAQDSFPSWKELTIFKNHSSSLQVSLQELHRFGS